MLMSFMRGVIADNAQAIHDANAVTILRQQIREAAGALATARRELPVA
ncbi:phage shock protein C, partial [Methylobacterium sp. WL7]